MKTLKQVFKPEVTVQEIHDEFDTASEAFLQQIKEILKDTNESEVENANKLKQLGFRQSGNVKKYDKLIQSTKEAEEAKAYIEDYATRYTEKFITEKMVELICTKYGLVLGDVSSFIGEIPVKNAKEIIKFSEKFRAKDLRTDYRSTWGMASSAFTVIPQMIRSQPVYIPPYIPEADWMESQSEAIQRMQRLQQEAQMRIRMQQMEAERERQQREEERITTPTFMVVGELSQFDMTNKKVDSKYRIVSDNPDPVVLAQVKGGYLIVSKWGAEADIQEFHNEKEN